MISPACLLLIGWSQSWSTQRSRISIPPSFRRENRVPNQGVLLWLRFPHWVLWWHKITTTIIGSSGLRVPRYYCCDLWNKHVHAILREIMLTDKVKRKFMRVGVFENRNVKCMSILLCFNPANDFVWILAIHRSVVIRLLLLFFFVLAILFPKFFPCCLSHIHLSLILFRCHIFLANKAFKSILRF